MGTLNNQSFEPGMAKTRDDKMRPTAPPTGAGSQGVDASNNMIGGGGAGSMRNPSGGNSSRAGMGSDRLPSGKLDSPKVP